jgi:hypothetical protein
MTAMSEIACRPLCPRSVITYSVWSLSELDYTGENHVSPSSFVPLLTDIKQQVLIWTS